MVSFRDFLSTFYDLKLPGDSKIIAHASLSAFGQVRGGASTVIGALLAVFEGVMMPTFTCRTMVIPVVGPSGNGIQYGSGKDTNQMAEFFQADMPADNLMGVISETLRNHSNARRSQHPLLSFAGVNVEHALTEQTLDEPLAPIRVLTEEQGWVLLLGVDHTVNTSVHYAEKLAGRRQFLRWALTLTSVQACPNFPGCSDGFNALSPYLESITRKVSIGAANVQALPLSDLVEVVGKVILKNPSALLCTRLDCQRCNATRAVSIR